MERIRDITQSILWGRAKPYPYFRIRADRVRGSRTSDAAAFVPQQTYFEIRLSQMHLRDRRRLWVEYIPSATFMLEFLFDGQRQVVPFVVGRDLLKGALPADDASQVEQLNTRVVGPYPYAGDDMRLFAGLFEIKVRDFAEPALSLLESVAKAFDATRLSSYINVAEPLLAGVEGILGLPAVDLRVGMQRTYESPRAGEEPTVEVLQPGYEVLFASDARIGGTTERLRFWVVDGKLHIGDSESNLKEYRDADFMLFRINALSARGDYTALDFHAIWKRVQEAIWKGDESASRRMYNELISTLGYCKDIIYPQRNALLDEYGKLFDSEVLEHKTQSKVPGRRFEGGARRMTLTEADLGKAAMRRLASGDFGPEDPEAAIASVSR